MNFYEVLAKKRGINFEEVKKEAERIKEKHPHKVIENIYAEIIDLWTEFKEIKEKGF